MSSPFTLDSQPFLLDSMYAYLKYALSKISSLDHTNLIQKLENSITAYIPTLTETKPSKPWKPVMSYKPQYPSISDRIRRREEVQDISKVDEPSVGKNKKTRGRKPKRQVVEQKRLLDEMRRKRRRKVELFHTEVSEFELIENVRVLIQVIRNLSFVKVNEHQLMKCTKLVDVIISLFIEYIDKEITFN